MAGKSGKGVGTRAKPRTGSSKAGLSFPVGRTLRYIKQGRYSEQVGVGGAVFLAAVLEYVTSEILELAGNACSENGKKTIAPRHIQLAVRNDEELNKLMVNTTIIESGVLPNVQPFLFPKKDKKGKKAAAPEGTQEM